MNGTSSLTTGMVGAIVLIQQYNSTLVREEPKMSDTPRPLQPIAPAGLVGDRRTTVIRSTTRDRDGIFRGWGPSI
jgi:hypothetical protein